MTRETKIGCVLVLILVSTFGVLLYKRMQNPNIASAKVEVPAELGDVEAPTAPPKTAASDPLAAAFAATNAAPAPAAPGNAVVENAFATAPAETPVRQPAPDAQPGFGSFEAPARSAAVTTPATTAATQEEDPFAGEASMAAAPMIGTSVPVQRTAAELPSATGAAVVEEADPFAAEMTAAQVEPRGQGLSIPVEVTDAGEPAMSGPATFDTAQSEPTNVEPAPFGSVPVNAAPTDPESDPFGTVETTPAPTSQPAVSLPAHEADPLAEPALSLPTPEPRSASPAMKTGPSLETAGSPAALSSSDEDPFGGAPVTVPTTPAEPRARLSLPVEVADEPTPSLGSPEPAELSTPTPVPTFPTRTAEPDLTKTAAVPVEEADPFGSPPAATTPAPSAPTLPLPTREPAPPQLSLGFGAADEFAPGASVPVTPQPTVIQRRAEAPQLTITPTPAPAPAFRSEPAPVRVAAPTGGDTYVVQPNDNLWSISRQVYGSGKYFQALALHNQQVIPNPDRMKPGVTIATPPAAFLEQQYARAMPAGTTAAASQPALANTAPSGFFIAQGAPMYRVGDKDTLSSIAQRHLGRSSRWVQVLELNRDQLKSGDALPVGAVLKLPLDASQVEMISPKPSF